MSKKHPNKEVASEYNRQAYIRRKKRIADNANGILTWRQIRQAEYKTEGQPPRRRTQEPLVDREKPVWQFISPREWIDTPEDREEVRQILARRVAV